MSYGISLKESVLSDLVLLRAHQLLSDGYMRTELEVGIVSVCRLLALHVSFLDENSALQTCGATAGRTGPNKA